MLASEILIQKVPLVLLLEFHPVHMPSWDSIEIIAYEHHLMRYVSLEWKRMAMFQY